jgi:hypothetical protein
VSSDIEPNGPHPYVPQHAAEYSGPELRVEERRIGWDGSYSESEQRTGNDRRTKGRG